MRRRNGRPPLVDGQRSVALTVQLPPAVFDALAKRALSRQLALSQLVRAILSGFTNENSRLSRLQSSTDNIQ